MGVRQLVAEDDAGLRSVLERGLQRGGYVVDAVADGGRPRALTSGAPPFPPAAGGSGLMLVLALERAWVDAAPDWMDRLTGTLLDNARRHAASTVRVAVRSSGARALLVVEDDGLGIPPAARPTLFDRFRRATDEPGGAGLGLAIADSVGRVTGGRWRVGTSPLDGSSMEVAWRRSQLPADVPPAHVTRPATAAPNPNGGSP